MSEQQEINEPENQSRYSQAKKILFKIAEEKHKKLETPTTSINESQYHRFNTHVIQLLKISDASWPTVTALSPENVKYINAAADEFSQLITHPFQRPVSSPDHILEFNSQDKAAIQLIEEDHLMQDLALLFHDVGRYILTERQKQEGLKHRKFNHELRSATTLLQLFQTEPGLENEKAELAKLFPKLFDPKNLEATLLRVAYIIMRTHYILNQDQRHEFMFELDIPDDEQDKLYLLGSLALITDVGGMQILPYPDSVKTFFGLIDEYGADDPELLDQNVPGTVRDWVYDWTDRTRRFALICSELQHPQLTPKERQRDFVGHRFSRSIRSQFLRFLTAQGYDINQSITIRRILAEKNKFLKQLEGKL